EQPRLERLRQVLAEPARVALEDQPAVGAEPGDRGVRPGLLAGSEAIEAVADVAQPSLWREEPSGCDDRRGEGRADAGARALDQAFMAEGHVLGAQRAVEQAADVVLARAEVELRHAMVRRDDRRER